MLLNNIDELVLTVWDFIVERQKSNTNFSELAYNYLTMLDDSGIEVKTLTDSVENDKHLSEAYKQFVEELEEDEYEDDDYLDDLYDDFED